MDPTGRAARGARWAPAAAAVAVVAVVAVVAAALGTRGGDVSSAPPPLRLLGWAAAETASSSAVSARAGGYRLEGDLPADGPSRGRVHRLPAGAASEDDVRRLAAALGVAGEPVRDGDRWTVRDSASGTTLDVSAEPGQPWWYGAAADEPLPVEPLPGTQSGGSSPGCPEPSGTAPTSADDVVCHVVTAAPPPASPAIDAVAVQKALDAVRPLLDRLGLAGAELSTEAYGEARGVLAAPRVEGLPTQGWETRFEVGADGGLLSAAGMLGSPVAGEEYPLVGAQQAFEQLAAQPRPDLAAACAPEQPCGPVEQVVTGARPGLQLHVDGQGPLLVPAWLFSVLDSPLPVGQVAVDPAHLQPAEPVEPLTPVAPSTPVEPGAPVEPDAPVEPGAPVQPGAPGEPDAPGPPQERTTFAFDRAARGAQPAEVVVGYGDSGSCPHTSVTPLVEETDETVVVTLTADATAPDTPCTADYLAVDLRVPLTAPLGDRVLVDGVTGQRHELP